MAMSALISRVVLLALLLSSAARSQATDDGSESEVTASASLQLDFTTIVNGTIDSSAETSSSLTISPGNRSQPTWADPTTTAEGETQTAADNVAEHNEQTSDFTRESPVQTDSTYLSTTFTRAGERTLLSLSSGSPHTEHANESMSSNLPEQSTDHTKNDDPSSHSESTISSATQTDASYSVKSKEPAPESVPNPSSNESSVNEWQPSTDVKLTIASNSTLPVAFENNATTSLVESSSLVSSLAEELPFSQSPSTFPLPVPSLSSTSRVITENETEIGSDSMTDVTVMPRPSARPSEAEVTEATGFMTTDNATTSFLTLVTSRSAVSDTDDVDDSTILNFTIPPSTTSTTRSTEQFPGGFTTDIRTMTDTSVATKGPQTLNTPLPGSGTQDESLPPTTQMYELSTAKEQQSDEWTSFVTQKTIVPLMTNGTSTPAMTTEVTEMHTTSTLGPSTSFTAGLTRHPKISTTTPGQTRQSTVPTTVTYRTSAPSTTTETTTTERASTTTSAQVTSRRVTVATTSAPANTCKQSPCLNNGTCAFEYQTGRRVCICTAAWMGENCGDDVDECLTNPCPPNFICVNTNGSFNCECPFVLEDGRCIPGKTFKGIFEMNFDFNNTKTRSSETLQMQRLIEILNASLASYRGYYKSGLLSTETHAAKVHIFVESTFSKTSDVTAREVFYSVHRALSNCSFTSLWCEFARHFQLSYRALSLCTLMGPLCDTETSICIDEDGFAVCHCKDGYFKFGEQDHACKACRDGYKLVNGTCVICDFGFGGFNCNNPYKFIMVVVAAAGGGLLLIMAIALIVTCCRKDKNDISKFIFKSGDFQMSPYAEYPKNNRISADWGRETIEMQENGSTKNLLQMTDIYYSPGLRNHELDQSGLFPYSGLPGSRHSCIYPGQYNPSFICEDSRRRDYF
ncbi:protein HEG isoform X1 [Erpetoichthys calabaricus]|uniref:protein HEG isoform X1 n=1 Tax=Erpetoichthys calabaricus TaxID=27687 RepID=UPI002234C9B0|nr:protein HEG isoform X1 [Erpetoichthys calabaricus]